MENQSNYNLRIGQAGLGMFLLIALISGITMIFHSIGKPSREHLEKEQWFKENISEQYKIDFIRDCLNTEPGTFEVPRTLKHCEVSFARNAYLKYQQYIEAQKFKDKYGVSAEP